MECLWKWFLVLYMLFGLCSILATNKCTIIRENRELREIYERMVRKEEEKTTHIENNNPTNTIANNVHVIEELLHPQLSWEPRKKVSIYNIIIKRLWDKILRLGNDRHRIIKLRRYIMKKLNITDTSQQEYFSLTTPSGVKEGGEEEIEKRGKDRHITFTWGDCHMKGKFYKLNGVKRRQLCKECFVNNSNTRRFPKLLVEKVCGHSKDDQNTDQSCIDGYGVCKQNYVEIEVLKKTSECFKDNFDQIFEAWSISNSTETIRSSCSCRLKEDTIKKYFTAKPSSV